MTRHTSMQALRSLALSYPEAQEGTACTRSAFKARNKAFLFMGASDAGWTVMLKLRESLPEAAALADREPGICKAGASGWVTLTFGPAQSPPPGILERWIDESYRLLAPRPLVALLRPPAVPAAAPPSKATKSPPKSGIGKRAIAKKTVRTRR